MTVVGSPALSPLAFLATLPSLLASLASCHLRTRPPNTSLTNQSLLCASSYARSYGYSQSRCLGDLDA